MASLSMDESFIQAYLQSASPEQLRAAFLSLLPPVATREQKVAAVQGLLESPAGRALRSSMGKWIVDLLVPVEHLVPEAYATWRPPVRDAMLFVVEHLSDARLAPKLLEQ